MSFRLVPIKSVSMNDLERRNNGMIKDVTMRYFTEFGSFQAHYVKLKLQIHRHFLRQKCSQRIFLAI